MVQNNYELGSIKYTRVYDASSYLVLISFEKYDATYNRIRYLISLKSGMTCFFSLLWENQSWFLWFLLS